MSHKVSLQSLFLTLYFHIFPSSGSNSGGLFCSPRSIILSCFFMILVSQYDLCPSRIRFSLSNRFYWKSDCGLAGNQGITWLIALALAPDEPGNVVSE